MGRLSTHVLDTVHGKAAPGVVIELHCLGPDLAWHLLANARTNADGRTDKPLLDADAFKPGTYMLSFHMGDYFRTTGAEVHASPFLDIVPLRFTMAEPDGHYHVPLLATPWSYSTYRGS